MKNYITMLIAMFAAGFVLAADYDIFVDTQINDPQFVMQVEDGSTNTVTFNILSNGAPITATSYTPVLYIDSTYSFGSPRVVCVTGTTTASSATFSMTNVAPYRGYNNWKVLLMLGSTNAAFGTLEIDPSPRIVSGDPASIVAGGGVPVFGTTTITTNAYTCTSSDYGKLIVVNTNAAVAITLPANAAPVGAWIDVTVKGGCTTNCIPTISAATADTMVGKHTNGLDSVSYGTNAVGGYARFWSDGAVWHAQNLSDTPMTYTD